MDNAIHAALARWGNFYLLTGTAAAALTGLQFVVQSFLASNARRAMEGDDPTAGIDAFGTPTVVHFTLALVVSAMLCVPWPGYGSLAAALGIVGAGALAYSGVVLRRARRQRSYVPVAEDWIWHVLLPAASYATVLLAAALLGRAAQAPQLMLGAATLLLLCIGIHNAWDTVTYLTIAALRTDAPAAAPAPTRRSDSGKRRKGRR
jgi:hypothetical protein